MKCKILFIILVASIMLLSGCDVAKKWFGKIPSKLPGFDTEEEQTTFGGTGAISPVIAHPKKDEKTGYGIIKEGYSFSPVVRITNYGGSEAEGQTCITGLDSETFLGFPGCDCEVFQQRRIDGIFEPVDLKFGPYDLPQEDQEEREYGFSAITRYRYGTIIVAKAKIVKEAYEDAGDEADIVSVTSGPIEIDSIDSRTIPLDDHHVTVIFDIYVENEGNGNLWDIDRLNEECEPSSLEPIDEREKKLRAEILSFPVGANTICEETALDEDGEGIITCEAREISLYDPRGNYLFEDYEPEIIFELEYAYETRSSTKFKIL